MSHVLIHVALATLFGAIWVGLGPAATVVRAPLLLSLRAVEAPEVLPKFENMVYVAYGLAALMALALIGVPGLPGVLRELAGLRGLQTQISLAAEAEVPGALLYFAMETCVGLAVVGLILWAAVRPGQIGLALDRFIEGVHVNAKVSTGWVVPVCAGFAVLMLVVPYIMDLETRRRAVMLFALPALPLVLLFACGVCLRFGPVGRRMRCMAR